MASISSVPEFPILNARKLNVCNMSSFTFFITIEFLNAAKINHYYAILKHSYIFYYA